MNKAFNNFYFGKKVLITGHTGFKGAWLSIILRQLGASVIGVALDPPSKPSLFELAGLEAKVNHYHCDIRSSEELIAVFHKEQPEIVFHLAAQSIVLTSYDAPMDTFSTNVMGTISILEAVRQTKSIKSAVIVTSDKCYENKEWQYSYRENDHLGGLDPYSASKGCAEIVMASYYRSFFNSVNENENRIGIASARAGNVIGGGDWSSYRLIPDIVRAISQNRKLEIRNINSYRPWQHVLDPLFGYLTLAWHIWQSPVVFSEAWNFGPLNTSNCSVRQVIDEVLKRWEIGREIIQMANSKRHEAGFLSLDCSKARLGMDWFPVWGFEESIKNTIEWYQNYYDQGDAFDAVKESEIQISKYMDDAFNKGLLWAQGILSKKE